MYVIHNGDLRHKSLADYNFFGIISVIKYNKLQNIYK